MRFSKARIDAIVDVLMAEHPDAETCAQGVLETTWELLYRWDCWAVQVEDDGRTFEVGPFPDKTKAKQYAKITGGTLFSLLPSKGDDE